MSKEMGPLKKMLEDMLAQKKEAKLIEDATRETKVYEERNQILSGIGKDMGGVIQPFLDKLGEHSKMSAEELKRIISESVQVTVPNIDTSTLERILAESFANFKIPEPKITLNVPKQSQPIVNVPAPIVKMPDAIRLTPNDKPFPVMMVDQAGKPMMFPVSSGGGGGGKADFFTIKDIQTSTGASIIDDAGNVKISGAISVSSSTASTQTIDSSGDPYSQANPMPVVVVSGGSATTASAIVDSSGVQYSGSNPVPIAIISGSSSGATGQGDAASATRVVIAGNSDASVVVNSGTITTVTTLTGITNTVGVVALDRDGTPLTTGPIAQGDSATALRVILAGNSDASVVVNSGTITTVTTLTGITNTVGVVAVDRDGTPQSSGPVAQGDSASAFRVVVAGNSDASVVVNSGTLTTVTTLTSITNTVAAANVDSSGVQYSGSNPIPTTLVGGGPDSIFVFQARTTLPTAVSDGADVRPKADKLGRGISRPVNARELIATAYITLSTGTETTLLAGTAGQYIDLLQVVAANTSSVAQQVDFRCGTAGNIVLSLSIPANATAGAVLNTPWPQDATGNTWTADGPDNTNSSILISALFSKES
jgi:hypothetical protein